MKQNITMLWVEAGKKLAADSSLIIKCPTCQVGNLKVKDFCSNENPEIIEREMRCEKCQAVNYLRLRRVLPT